ncbi:MAG: hypothetical protein GY703_04720 [Gammaproteobacteria bacterium]|nr:hypothetical protein [Gammaproteobacteria bacterium]
MMDIIRVLVTGLLRRWYDNLRNLLTGTRPPAGAAGLTVLCPIINDSDGNQSHVMALRQHLQDLPLHENSPMAAVPNTYLCRFYILNDVFYQGAPAEEEHLKSKYLVYSTNFHGDLDSYLSGMWEHAQESIRQVWRHCVAFENVRTTADFVAYMKKCQVRNHLFFNGSTGDPLNRQLKSLYLKQEFSRFVYDHQNTPPEDLQRAFQAFIARTQPGNPDSPTWVAGADTESIKT